MIAYLGTILQRFSRLYSAVQYAPMLVVINVIIVCICRKVYMYIMLLSPGFETVLLLGTKHNSSNSAP